MKILKAILFFGAAFALQSCSNLTKNVEISLPKFEPQMVVEGYLEPNEPLRVSVSRTLDYFAPLTLPFISNARVVLSYNGITDTLIFNPIPDFENLKWFNYQTRDSVPVLKGVQYTLTVIDSAGKRATASTSYLDFPKIDSVGLSSLRERDTSYFLLTYFQDLPGPSFYRFRVSNLSDSAADNQDFVTNDLSFEGKQITFGTGYDFQPGDTAVVRVYHLRKDYYDYLASISAANSANGNPFGSPASIKSNFTGAMGIFTPLMESKVIKIIP